MSKKKYKVLVAHPGKQHSFHTATALEKNENLYAYCTTIYQSKGSITELITRFLKKDNKKKANSRYCKYIPEEKVNLFCEIDSLIYLILKRISKNNKLNKKVYMYIVNKFGKKVAKFAINNNVDAVIMYDETSVSCFEIIKKKAPHIKCILDVSTVNRLYITKVYESDMCLYKHNNFKKELPFLWEKKNINYYKKEIKLTDNFIFPSKFVKKSYTFSDDTIKNYDIIPYGVDSNKFIVKEEKKRECNSPLTLIFVGQISLYKGLHHLLNVVSSFSRDKVKLKLIGDYSLDNILYKKFSNFDNIEFCGFINFDELPNYYSKSDVFVFPTLGEGFGLVVLEAMSMELPIICSKNAGGNDVIKEGINGFTYNPLNEKELYSKIKWFIENKDKLNSMGENSKKSAKQYTWDNYYYKINKYIVDILSKKE